MDKFSLPEDVSKCSNTNCTIRKNCKRNLEYHPIGFRTLVSNFEQKKNLTCDYQIKIKK